jgi:hypothetical protein
VAPPRTAGRGMFPRQGRNHSIAESGVPHACLQGTRWWVGLFQRFGRFQTGFTGVSFLCVFASIRDAFLVLVYQFQSPIDDAFLSLVRALLRLGCFVLCARTCCQQRDESDSTKAFHMVHGLFLEVCSGRDLLNGQNRDSTYRGS